MCIWGHDRWKMFPMILKSTKIVTTTNPISGSPLPFYAYVGKAFGSPYYGQVQSSVPYQGGYPQVFPYSFPGSPYSVSSYSASPYSGPVVAPVYPGYNYPFVHQYYPGYPSYYHNSNEVQNANKQ